MIVPGQTTEVKWNSANKVWYISKGYIFSKIKNSLVIKVEDLTKSAENVVEFICDYCNNMYLRAWNVNFKSTQTNKKHSCMACSGKKKIETKIINGTLSTDKLKDSHISMRVPYSVIENVFMSKGYSLITKTYKSNKQQLIFICNVHSEFGHQTTTSYRLRKLKHNCILCQKLSNETNRKENFNKNTPLETYKKVLNGSVANFPSGYFKYIDNEDIKIMIKHFIDISVSSNKNNRSNIIKALTNENLCKYKLSSLAYNFGLHNLVKLCFEDIEPWELSACPPNFWNNKENIINATNWFVEKLILDNIISSEDDIIKIKNWRRYFKKYRLEGLLSMHFGGSIYDFWNFTFQDRWFEWEFLQTKRNYWGDKENVIKSMKQLIHKIGFTKEDIPNKLTYPYLVKNHYKFAFYCDKYFHSNIYAWINECYPGEFNELDFKDIVTNDGVEVDSYDEQVIHNILLDNGIVPLYFENKATNSGTFKNEKYNESYVPDWIIDDKLIVEYFGWYHKKSEKYKLIKKYIDKADRKVEFFTQLPQYDFIALYPDDIIGDMQGLYSKFKNCGIHLNPNKQIV